LSLSQSSIGEPLTKGDSFSLEPGITRKAD
jgi:hypothetical protein